MSKQLSFNLAGWSEYRRLLEESPSALEIWNEHRGEFCRFRFVEREAGDEFLRLQTKHARAYPVEQNHERDCSLRQLAARMEGRHSEIVRTLFPGFEMRAWAVPFS